MSSQCPKKVHSVEDVTTASQVSSQDTTTVGAIGSYFDLGSVSGGIPEPRGAGEEICAVGVSSVREGEIVDIEVDSGAELSCLLAGVGADTYPAWNEAQHVWRRLAANCMTSVPGFLGWKLDMCEAM